jgi:hypothetical protein
MQEYQFTADGFIEKDGSVTLSLRELDIADNAKTEKEARKEIGESILRYSEDFCSEYAIWSKAPNRKRHIPYVLKALIINDSEKIGDIIKLRNIKNYKN